MSKLGVRILRHTAALEDLARVWNRFDAGNGAPMRDYDWTRICAARFAGRARLHLIVVGEPDAAAVAPLVLKRGPVPRLSPLGAEALREPVDFLYADHEALAELAEALLDLGLPIVLNPIYADSPTLRALRASLYRRGVAVERPCFSSPWIPLGSTWTEPERHLNGGRRSDLRRARRIARRMGEVRFEVEEPRGPRVQAVLEEAMAVEAAGWKGRVRTSLLHDSVRGPFYRCYAEAAAERGALRVLFLRIGDRPAAMQIAVESGGRFWLLKVGYDETFARCSPGTLLLAESIAEAARRELHSFEFLGCAEPWTRAWTRHVRAAVDFRVYSTGRNGALAFLEDAPRIGWRLGRPVDYGLPVSPAGSGHARSDATGFSSAGAPGP